MTVLTESRVMTDANIVEYFQEQVTAAVTNQRIDAEAETVYYLVNLLASFTDVRALFEKTPDGWMLKPLAEQYATAVAAQCGETRTQALKRLGDVALFVAGFFSDSLNRKLVDIDYYIAMGGTAYACLSSTVKRSRRRRMQALVFDELASKFALFVDVLDEVSEHCHLQRNSDVMRLYEIWMRTGSKRAERRLRNCGIHPIGSLNRTQH